MRVLLTTRGSRGDVEPLAGLAAHLRSIGAEARVLAPPDQEFADLLGRAGVEHVPVYEPVRDLVVGITSGKIPRMTGNFQEHVQAIVSTYSEALLEAGAEADVIVATGLFPVPATARTVSEKLGIQFVKVALQPTTLPSHVNRPHAMPGWEVPADVTDNRALWKRDIEVMNDLFGPAVNRLRESLGLAPVDNVRDHTYTDRPWLATDPVLSPWEATDLDVVQTGAWILPDGRALPAELEAFLAAGEAPVYVGFGSIPVKDPEEAARVAVEAVRSQGRRLVVGSGWAGLGVIDDSDDCFVVGEVNQQALFGRVAAIVHHGGAGTTTTASRSGTPQVVVPQIVDQPYWAGRVAELGIGVAHEGKDATVESLTVALGKALAPGMRERAEEAAGTMRTDGVEVAAGLLEKMVG